jgi:hypothetical protein
LIDKRFLADVLYTPTAADGHRYLTVMSKRKRKFLINKNFWTKTGNEEFLQNSEYAKS